MVVEVPVREVRVAVVLEVVVLVVALQLINPTYHFLKAITC